MKIVMRTGRVLRGHVVDYETGQPVSMCRVEASFGEREMNTATKGDGSFEIAGAAEGQTVRLHLSAAQYITDWHDARTKGDNEEDIGLIKLVPGRWKPGPPPQSLPRFTDWMLEGNVENTVVAAIRAGSQAEKIGIVPGAVITSVAGKDARNLGPWSIEYLRSESGPVSQTGLRLPDGSARSVEW